MRYGDILNYNTNESTDTIMKTSLFLLLGLSLLALPVAAEECHVELENDFRVSSKLLEVSSAGEMLYEIRQGGEVWVNDEPLSLNEEQTELAEQYAGDVGALAAQWVEFVSATLDLIGESLQVAFGEAFGKDSDTAVQTGIAVAKAREKFDAMSRPEEGVYTVNAEAFNDLGEVIGEEIEEAVQASVGSLMIELGRTIRSGEGSFTERMEDFGDRMESMGRGLEHMGDALKETNGRLCSEFHALQKLERQLGKDIPELKPYPLFNH